MTIILIIVVAAVILFAAIAVVYAREKQSEKVAIEKLKRLSEQQKSAPKKVVINIAQTKSTVSALQQKSPSQRKIDNFEAYHTMYKRAEKIRDELEGYIENNYDDIHLEKHQNKILQRFDQWLRQNEEATRFTDYDGITWSSSAETVFGILVKRKMLTEGEAFVGRLDNLKWNDASGDWKKAIIEVECEEEEESMPEEISRDKWREMAQRQIPKLLEAKHLVRLRNIVNESIGLQEPDVAQLAVSAMLSIGKWPSGEIISETSNDIIFYKADISMIRKDYNEAIKCFQQVGETDGILIYKADIEFERNDYNAALKYLKKAYTLVDRQCANKTQLKKIESKTRKVLRTQGIKKPTDEQVKEALKETN